MSVKPVMTIIDTTITNAINIRSGANVESILKLILDIPECRSYILLYFSFNIRRKTLRETPMLLAPVIIISPFVTPYSTHNESPVINEIMSHFETSSVRISVFSRLGIL
jgi:hypothetical protein